MDNNKFYPSWSVDQISPSFFWQPNNSDNIQILKYSRNEAKNDRSSK